MLPQILIITTGILTIIPIILYLIYKIGILKQQKKKDQEKWICLKISPHKLSERNPNVFEQALSAIHSSYQELTLWQKLTGKTQPNFALEIANTDGKIYFFIRCPKKYQNLITSQIWANNPEVEITKVKDYTNRGLIKFNKKKNYQCLGVELGNINSDLWTIKRYNQFEDKIAKTLNDPIAGMLLPLARLNPKEQAWVQIAFQPLNPDPFYQRGIQCLKILSQGSYSMFDSSFQRAFMSMKIFERIKFLPKLFFFWILRKGKSGLEINLNTTQEENSGEELIKNHDKETPVTASVDKLSRLPFNTAIRILHFGKDFTKTHEIASSFKQFTLPQLNGFKINKSIRGNEILYRYQNAIIDQQLILSVEELATIYHFPNQTVQVPNLDWVFSKKLEPPTNLPIVSSPLALLKEGGIKKSPSDEGDLGGENLTILGKTNFRGLDDIFGVRKDDRRRHIYIVGKTGMGKSTLLENMIFSDIHQDKGIAVIDPHGDLAEAVIDFVPAKRTNDVVIFDPSDTEHPISFNMLESRNPANNHLVASGVLGVFKKMFADSWGPRLEHILRNSLLALIEAPNTTMLGIMKILVDKKYRQQILKSVTDPMVLSFWQDEFGQWDKKQATEAISPIQNKVGQFLSSSMIRNILGQPKSSIDLRFAMDKGKIIIINLSKGKIGEDNSALLGSMLVTKFQLDVMSRADIPEKERKDFYLYVDEFQNFATDAFATILSEARKYRLNLTVANQYLAQMPDEVRDAIFGNVGTMVTFQVGFDDAEELANQFGGEQSGITSMDIGGLPKYQVYLRLMIDGMPSVPFSANTIPPPEFEIDSERREKLLKVCRQRYGKERKVVEERIKKWTGV